MVDSVWTDADAAAALDEGLRELGMATAWRPRVPAIPPADRIALSDGQVVTVRARFRRPAAALLDNVLSPEECEQLIAHAMQKGLAPSSVVDAGTGQSVGHHARSSTGVFMTMAETPVIACLERRLGELTGWPLTHGEGLQVLRYAPGQEYRAHFDWFDPAKSGSAVHLARGGQRVGTTVVYLAVPDAGGGTSFPTAGLDVLPRAGGAIFFQDVDGLGRPDPMSLHAGVPVVQGVKIVATYWQRQGPFRERT